MDLKLLLSSLKNTELENLTVKDLDVLIASMLDNIGSIDSELRDDLIFSTFMRLIEKDLLTISQKKYILKTCLDKFHLFNSIGERNTDSVFTRSFSSLVIAGILANDKHECLLSKDDFMETLLKTIEYMQNEMDTRGYVEGKGWAHSIAHGADLLAALVRHPSFPKAYESEILNTVSLCLYKKAIYIDDEDERLSFVIEALIERDLDQKELKKWITANFNVLESISQKEGYSNNYFRTKFTIASFFKTLYFRMFGNSATYESRTIIEDELKQLHKKIYNN